MARAFNQRADKCWSQLHRAAKVRADRATRYKGKLLVRVWEKQKRGLAHVHGVIAVGTPAERGWAKAYVEALRELAPRYGFGFMDGWHKIGRKFWPGEQAAAYLSSYFVAGRRSKASITENVWRKAYLVDRPVPGQPVKRIRSSKPYRPRPRNRTRPSDQLATAR